MTTSYPITASAPHYDATFKLMHGGTGAWQFYVYEDVQKVLFDSANFSNSYMSSGDDRMLGSNINQVDPPLHGKLRNLINAPFSKTAIESHEPWIQEICCSLLPTESRSMELASEFAFPFTTAVICRLLGVPEKYHNKVNGWAKAIVTAGYAVDGFLNAAIAQKEMGELFLTLLEARVGHPQEDILTVLANEGQSDEILTLPVKIGTCMTLLLAGFETTANMLTNCVHTLTEIPMLQQVLDADQQKIPALIQETLRLKPSLVSMYRKAKVDMNFSGCQIQKGDMINAWVSVANRDPEVFNSPHSFDLNRTNLSKVLSFGYGIHHCIGAVLARVQGRIAIELLLSRYKNIQLQKGTVLIPASSLISSGFQELPITFNS